MIDETMDTVEQSAAPVEQPVEAPATQQPTQQQIRETEQANNFRAIKKAAEQAARERDEMARRLQEYESARKVESPDEDFTLKPDDLVEAKHLKKYENRIKQLEEQQKQYIQQNSASTAEIKLRSQYSDFDKVMTQENIEKLSEAFPEVAQSVSSSPDLYNKAASVYTMIKKFGIYTETPYDSEKQRVAENAAKPRPLASVSPQQGDSPLSRANAFAEGLTPELKEQLRKEMEAARKLY